MQCQELPDMSILTKNLYGAGANTAASTQKQLANSARPGHLDEDCARGHVEPDLAVHGISISGRHAVLALQRGVYKLGQASMNVCGVGCDCHAGWNRVQVCKPLLVFSEASLGH